MLDGLGFRFQANSKFAFLAFNGVATQLSGPDVQLSDSTWVLPRVPVSIWASGSSG